MPANAGMTKGNIHIINSSDERWVLFVLGYSVVIIRAHFMIKIMNAGHK